MAERLAPVAAAPRITSRPERPRGRARRVVRRLLVGVVALALLLAGTVATLHFLAIHRSAQEVRATALVPAELPARVLVVVARPGQELPMAGTLAALQTAGVEVALLSLTRGEDQPPALAFAGDRLAGIRADELARSAEVLGIDRASSADYPDGGLLAAEPAEVQARIAEAIADTEPSAILTISDTTGEDTDAQAVAAYALAAAQAEGSPVARVWTVTRGDREQDWRALAGGATATQLVPEPQVSVVLDAASTGTKGAALLAHGTQGPDLVRATYPLADRLPAWAYFRFWDREYFALAWGQPMA
jgi:LmbE family N-acetylglucosaminyl deacetylase